MWPANTGCWKLFWRISRPRGKQGSSCGHASKRPTDRWTVKFLVAVRVEVVVGRTSVARVTLNRAVLCVSLGVSQVWARAQLALKVSAPTLQLDFVDSALSPTASSDPMFLFCLGYCCLLSLRTGETGSSGKCLNFSVWKSCHRCHFSVSTEGDPAGQWGGVTRGKSCRRSLKSLRMSMRCVSHLGSHHTPIHGKPFFLCLLYVTTLTYPGDCCFAVFLSRNFH